MSSRSMDPENLAAGKKEVVVTIAPRGMAVNAATAPLLTDFRTHGPDDMALHAGTWGQTTAKSDVWGQAGM